MSGTAVRSPVYQPPFVLLLANIDSNPAQTFGTLGFLPYSLEEKGKTGKRRKKEEKKGAKQQRIAVQNDLRSTRNTKTLRLDRRLNREEFKKNDDNQVDLEYTEYKKINRKVLEVLAGHFASCIRPVLYLEFSFLTKAAFALSIKASSSPLCSHMS